MKRIYWIGLITAITMLFSGKASQAQVSGLLEGGMMQFTRTETGVTQIGLQITGKYAFNDNFRMGANLGYYLRNQQDTYLGTYNTYTMPVTVLAEIVFFRHDFSPYAGADAGIYRQGRTGTGATSDIYTGFAPLIGFDYTVSESFRLNANFKYHFIFSELHSTNALGVNAGVIFDF